MQHKHIHQYTSWGEQSSLLKTNHPCLMDTFSFSHTLLHIIVPTVHVDPSETGDKTSEAFLLQNTFTRVF